MVNIGTVTGQEIAKNRDGSIAVRMLQVRISSDDDIQSVQYFPMSGDDSPPLSGDPVVILSIGEAFKVAIGVQGSVSPSMPEGEKKIYSRDSSGDIAAFINLLTGGVVEINGNADNAVRFSKLKEAFDQLQSDFDGHDHLYTPGSGTPTQTAPPAASSVDIDPSKVDEVKLP